MLCHQKGVGGGAAPNKRMGAFCSKGTVSWETKIEGAMFRKKNQGRKDGGHQQQEKAREGMVDSRGTRKTEWCG